MLKILELTKDELKVSQENYILVDVREAYELEGPEGKIEGILRATLGNELSLFLKSADKTKSYVFICRSGYRSGKACELAYAYGIPNAYNLKGGMLAWNEK
ncbi:MAG: rhodanese-like domain-containing protein [Proteobacteria bacterium]|nr:rhodanese-like domain-containing protein [Pseudomonadota bacterium]